MDMYTLINEIIFLKKEILSIYENKVYSAQYFTERQINELNYYKIFRAAYYDMPIIFSKLFLSLIKGKINNEKFYKENKKI